MAEQSDDQTDGTPDHPEASISETTWAFYAAAAILMLPPLIPIVAAFAPGWVPLPIDMSIPAEATATGWTVFLVSLGVVLLIVNITFLVLLRRWSQG